MKNRTKEIFTLFAEFSACALIAVFVAGLIGLNEADSGTESPKSPATGQTLQVRPAVGDPTPLQSPLQSPKGQTDQNAAGNLQRPQKADTLQPNASPSDYSELD